jgi:thiol-disulfide isomerase/thioredoxin
MILNDTQINLFTIPAASWCGPCKAVAPLYEKLSAKYGSRLTFLKVRFPLHARAFDNYPVNCCHTILQINSPRQADFIRDL